MNDPLTEKLERMRRNSQKFEEDIKSQIAGEVTCKKHPHVKLELNIQASWRHWKDTGEKVPRFTPCPECKQYGTLDTMGREVSSYGMPMKYARATLRSVKIDSRKRQQIQSWCDSPNRVLLVHAVSDPDLRVQVMAAIMRELWFQKVRPQQFTTLLNAAQQLRASYNRNTEDPATAAKRVRVLLVDGIGSDTSPSGQDVRAMMADIATERINQVRPLVLGVIQETGLSEAFGAEVASRILSNKKKVTL